MTKVDISAKGIEHLEKLKEDLIKISNEIEEEGQTLKSLVVREGDSLGVYEEKILELIEEIKKIEEVGRESLPELNKKLEEKIEEIKDLMKYL